MKSVYYLIYLLILLLGISCQPIQDILQNKNPRERYLNYFNHSDLGERAIVQKWANSWEEAKTDALQITLPYLETGIFQIANPETIAYSFQLKEGEKLVVEINSKVQFFAELFLGNESFKSLQFSENNKIEYTVKNSGKYILLLQADFLNGGKYELRILTGSSIGFPVSGKNTGDIKSFWGADRDGGKRSHKGVDIFAERGTPVVAVRSGAARADNNNLGGKVVWLYNAMESKSYYYAHLDSQRVKGNLVKAGDTLGFVGNTGNAKYTPPHLHFGIYKSGRGAVDPLPFIDNVKKTFPSIKTDTQWVGLPALVISNSANLRSTPSTKNNQAIASLQKNTAVFILSATSDWFLVQLENGTQAYLHSSTIKVLTPQSIELNGTYAVKDEFNVLPLDTLNFQDTLEGYAYSKKDFLIQHSDFSRFKLSKLNN